VFNVIILGIASLLTDISSEMVYPLIPLYLISIGASSSIIGLIEGMAESIASLLRVFSGYWSDKVQQRKPLTIVGYGMSTVGKFILFLSTTWPLVLIGRLADRFGKGIRTAPRDALIADSTSPGQRGRAFGLHRTLDAAGASLGVLVAYLFLLSLHAKYRSIFLFSVIPGVLGVFALFFVRQKITKRIPQAASNGKPKEPWWMDLGTRWRALDRKLKIFLVIIFIFALGNSSNQFLLLRGQNLGCDAATVLLMYLLYNVVKSLGSWPAGRLSDRIGRKTLLVLGYVAYGIVYVGFAIASAPALWCLFVIYGIYIAFTEGVEKALVSDIAPPEQRATLMGLHATFTGIGLLPASLIAGFLWDAFGPQATFYFGGGMGILAALALWLLI